VSFERGALIGKRYRLDRQIGSGGMGDVFAATDTVLERKVAIKIVDAVDARRAGETSAIFLREARNASAIGHPAVVRILDFGLHADLLPYIAMELLEGETLAELMRRRPFLPRAWALDVAARVLEGLAAAHATAVVHRDIKPENIFLARGSHGISPKLLDFGISKTLDHEGRATVTTLHGHVVGTPAYMSPEQARGLRHIDKRTDVYSMGVVLYEMLCGEVPFACENPGDLLMLIMAAEPDPPEQRVPDIPPALSEVVMRALAKEPDERFSDAAEMLGALLAAEPGLGASRGPLHGPSGFQPTSSVARAESRPSPLPVRPRRSLRYLVGAAVAALGFTLGVAFHHVRTQATGEGAHYLVMRPAHGTSTDPAAAARPPSPEPAAPETAPRDTPWAASPRALTPDLQRCLSAHRAQADDAKGLGLAFNVDTQGRISQILLTPEELAPSPLGTCLIGAARSMRFAKTATPTTFAVELSSRRASAP
jgi:serine/threonine-protein kinase